jgi:excisionase family DNA binding protein
VSDCERWRELVWALPGELPGEEEAGLRAHLEACAECREESEGVGGMRAALAPAVDEEAPGDEVLARVKARLALAQPAPASDVMTPEELAQLLRVSVEDVWENLDELPAFEFAGRVRFRRRAVEAWMEQQEERWRRQALSASVRSVVGAGGE